MPNAIAGSRLYVENTGWLCPKCYKRLVLPRKPREDLSKQEQVDVKRQ